MIQRGQDFRLTLEPRKTFRVGREHAGKQLQSNVAVKLTVVGAIHLSRQLCWGYTTQECEKQAAAGEGGHLERLINYENAAAYRMGDSR